jgi:hypothetical protein
VRIGIGQPCAMKRDDVAKDLYAVRGEDVLAEINANKDWYSKAADRHEDEEVSEKASDKSVN